MSLASNEDAQLGYSYQGRAGLASVQYARRNDTDGWRADVSGGLAITAAGVMPARRLDRSFAVVKVADYENLTVYVENQPIGRTDARAASCSTACGRTSATKSASTRSSCRWTPRWPCR
ncbi:MAG: fimbria/pilus outer membrane usher protein [Proteobacteria bacterium]|nr:fimbria/pilus outer membrane usher protein [Pseudomonadota bacterium]